MADGGTSTSGRIAGLDAWRAGLMLGGLLVHGAIWQQGHPVFEAIALASHSFRMGTFFAISGYLAACAMQRRSSEAWLRRRLVTLGVPFAFGMATIPPFMWWLAQLHGGALAQSALPFDWHHLWFLAALLLYSAAAACWAGRLTAWFERTMPDPRALRTVLLATAVASGALIMVSGALIKAMAPPAWWGALTNARLIGGYLPMFALGYLAARSIPLRESVMSNWRAPAATLLVIVGAYALWFLVLHPGPPDREDDLVGRILPLIGASLCPPAVFVLVLQTAARMKRTPPLVATLCDASYTVYLLHLPLLAAINTGFGRVDWNPLVEFAIATSTAGALSLAFHVGVVRRSALLKLLLNGEAPKAGLPQWTKRATTSR